MQMGGKEESHFPTLLSNQSDKKKMVKLKRLLSRVVNKDEKMVYDLRSKPSLAKSPT